MSAAGRSAVELLQKHGIKPNKTKRANDTLAERTADIVKEEKAVETAKGPSRNDLMMQAKERGIKNFRILNKEELLKVLSAKDTIEIDTIVTAAIQRWKSGWGTKAQKV